MPCVGTGHQFAQQIAQLRSSQEAVAVAVALREGIPKLEIIRSHVSSKLSKEPHVELRELQNGQVGRPCGSFGALIGVRRQQLLEVLQSERKVSTYVTLVHVRQHVALLAQGGPGCHLPQQVSHLGRPEVPEPSAVVPTEGLYQPSLIRLHQTAHALYLPQHERLAQQDFLQDKSHLA
eukprot:scaffold1744_cov340-Prasinococcus_capsulatus_cf.AAC.11